MAGGARRNWRNLKTVEGRAICNVIRDMKNAYEDDRLPWLSCDLFGPGPHKTFRFRLILQQQRQTAKARGTTPPKEKK
jgi:hypothetical protein